MEFFIKNLEELKKVSHYIKKNYIYRLICFYGDLGSGKTTLIKLLAQEFKVSSLVSSPSFSILNEYNLQEKQRRKIYHFDFYRIKNIQEIYDLGYEDYFFSNELCFIEWPEILQNLISEKHHKLKIEILGLTKRKITFL